MEFHYFSFATSPNNIFIEIWSYDIFVIWWWAMNSSILYSDFLHFISLKNSSCYTTSKRSGCRNYLWQPLLFASINSSLISSLQPRCKSMASASSCPPGSPPPASRQRCALARRASSHRSLRQRLPTSLPCVSCRMIRSQAQCFVARLRGLLCAEQSLCHPRNVLRWCWASCRVCPP